MRGLFAVLAITGFFASHAEAAIVITSNSDVFAGRAAFVASGTTQTQFDWDAATAGTVNGNTVTGALNIRDWVDEPGFEGNDLAIDGVESFDLIFAADHRSIGLAIITGKGVISGDVDLYGATFQFTAFNGNTQVGTANFSLAAGAVDQAWLTINATSGFRKIEVREIGAASAADQYFSDMYSSIENVGGVVPEPSTLAIWSGLGVMGLIAARQRRRVQ